MRVGVGEIVGVIESAVSGNQPSVLQVIDICRGRWAIQVAVQGPLGASRPPNE